MNCKNLMKNAYRYYDEKYELYKNIKSATSVSEDKYESDLKEANIKFYVNKKIILEANYEIMGRYYSKDRIFIWEWANVDSDKNMTYISKSILKYGLDIVINNSSDNSNEMNLNSFLKMLLINSRIFINNDVELKILTYISLYLSKKDYFTVFTDPKNPESFIYMFLYNIKTY